MNVLLEIRAGEGGADARLLVREQAKLYLRMCERSGAPVEILEDSPG